MSDPIGALKARVTLQRPTRIADEIGGAAIAWSNEGEVWAAIDAGGATQGADYDGAPSVAAFTVTINTRTDVRAGWRLIWGDRVLRIRGVANDGGARIALNCEEEKL
jgi:head-tail adaptor